MLSLLPLTLALGFPPVTWNSSQVAHDERLLGIDSSPGPVVIERFRKNMLTDAEANDVRRLVEQLGGDDFRLRDQAHRELTYWRAGAESILRQHEFDANLERRRRVRQILERGLGRWSNNKAEAAARLLRRSPSPEALQVLLEYLPYADDIGVQREIAATLREMAADNRDFGDKLRAAAADPANHSVVSFLADEKSEASPTLLALEQARGFFGMIAQGEAVKLADATRLPFSLGNGVTLTSPDQRDEFFKQAIVSYRGNQKSALTFLHVTRGEDYARFADEYEREFLALVPAHEVRAVHVRLRRDWQTEETGMVLVRVPASGAFVIGLGQAGIRGIRSK